MKVRHIVCAAALATPLAAQAAIVEQEHEVSYTYLDLGYSLANFATPNHPNPGETSDTAGVVRASFGLTSWMFVRGEYRMASFENEAGTDDFDTTEIRGGFGFNTALSDNLAGHVAFDAVQQGVESGGFDDDETGWSGEIGLRNHVNDVFELDTIVRYTAVDDLPTVKAATGGDFPGNFPSVIGRGLFFVTDNLQVLTEAELRDEDWIWTAGIRVGL